MKSHFQERSTNHEFLCPKSSRKSVKASTPASGTKLNSDALNPPIVLCPLNSYSPFSIPY